MANRYWVGGSGTWDTTTTHWSTSSGGTAGASAPTAADSVFFDQAGTYTVTLTGALTCLDFNVSAGAITFATGTAPSLTISGSMSITNVTPTWTATSGITFNATTSGKTVTTNGTSFATSFNFNGVGGVWTLGSSLTSTSGSGLSVNAGTFDTSSTGNYAVTIAGPLQITNTVNAIVNLNASTVTISTSGTAVNILGSSAVFNAGTSQINCTNVGAISLVGASKTFYNVAFTGVSATFNQAITITGSNTFNNLSFVGGSVYRLVTIAANQTVNGVLSTLGTAGNNRVVFASATTGLQWDLAVNGTPSLTDMDFRDIRVIGTAAPISGTRIGNLGGCSGITFSTPKTVYWNLAGGGNWTVNAWAATDGGAVNTDNFPLPQDTAVIGNTGLNASATVTINVGVYIGTLDMSSRTTAMTFATGTSTPFILGDLKLSTSVTVSGTGIITFAGRNTQTITSAGRTFTQPLTIDSPGGTVGLIDAMIHTGTNITFTNGTFNTNGFALTATSLVTNSTNVRAVNLGASAVSLTGTAPVTFTTVTNLTFNAGTSTITVPTANINFNGGGLTFYNVSFTSTTNASSTFISGNNTFNNLSVTTGTLYGLLQFSGNQTIGTLAAVSSTAIRRLFIQSNTGGTQRSLTVTTLTTPDCDFRDIALLGGAAGSSPTRAGDCGGNTGITFPSPKTVYWNLAGAQNWNATGWATSSGGTPDINNFPLAQDTAVFDNTGSVTGTITINTGWNIGTLNMSGRTTAMTLNTGSSILFVYGNWLFGTGVTPSGSTGITFSGRGTQTITSNGKTFGNPITIDNVTGTVQLADAITTTSSITLQSGTFDAVSYNVSASTFGSNTTPNRALRMGSGTWTFSGTSIMWNVGSGGFTSFSSGTSTIVFSDTSTSSRIFNGGGFFYNKIIIGGTTGISTFTFLVADTFGEIASTKTVAHTMAFGANAVRIGKWSVTGTAGNVVTVTGSGGLLLAGERVSGVDYLAMGTTPMSTTNPVEFYAGANSTGTGAGVILTAAPAAVTRYWRGGTGTWDATTTTNWSASSGGAGGASVPTSADTVIFDSASNATAYTVTLTATQLRCASLSVSGPASGNVTFAGTAPLSVTQSLTMASSGITRTYTGGLTFAGIGTGKTISCGQTLASTITINGIGASWALSAAFTTSSSTTLTNGSFDTAGFALSTSTLSTSGGVTGNPVTLSLGASTITSSTAGGGIDFTAATSTYQPTNLTFNAGTSTININGNGNVFYHGGKTFYNVALNDSTAGNATPLNQSIFTPTFNNLTIATASLTGFKTANLSSNLIINGTFTVNASSNALRRLFLGSDTLGTQRTITAAAVSGLRDIDMRDINCAGAATWTGTRIGDLGGNTNAPTSTPKTVYWNTTSGTGGSWASTVGWALTSGGTPGIDNLPLAQDTAIIQNTGLGTNATITMDGNWHIGTVDMSGRTNTMILATSTTTPTIYGDWKFGTGVFSTGTGTITFSGRGTQTITSNGITFTPNVTINSVSGTVQLADAFACSNSLSLTSGTFNAVSYACTTGIFNCIGTATRTLSMGSGLWTISGGGVFWIIVTTGLTFNKGTANIVVTNTSGSWTFSGGGLTYNKLTIAGTTAFTLTISGNNTFSEIACTRTSAFTITLGNTTQTVGAFTASSSAGNLLTITGTSAASFATLIYTGATYANLNYIVPTFLKVYDIGTEWYAGNNSTNGGSYGWIWAAGAVAYSAGGQFLIFF